jgi:hypothetical protein
MSFIKLINPTFFYTKNHFIFENPKISNFCNKPLYFIQIKFNFSNFNKISEKK